MVWSRLLLCVIFVLSFSDLRAQSTRPPTESPAPACDLLVVGGQRFDSTHKRFIANTAIAIKDGKICGLDQPMTATQTLQLPAGQFVLPGLVDCHAHYNVRLFRKRREEFQVLPVQYLANGVTVTFSCGEFDPEGMLALRRHIESGEKLGPRLINSGPYFGRARPGWRGEKPAEEIRQEVDFWAGQGVGGFKAKQIGPRELEVLIDQAHRHGLTVTGHLDSGFRGSVNPRDAILMGIDRVEHFLGGDAMPDDRAAYDSLTQLRSEMPEYQAIVRQFVEHGTWFDATLSAYGYFGDRGEEFDSWIDERQFFTPFVQQQVRERGPAPANRQFEKIYQVKLATTLTYFQAGGLLTLGTDHFSDGNYLPGFGAHRELEALVRCGIPPEEAIQIGTLNGAKALGIDRDHGSLEVGKSADLFVIAGDPLANIRETRKVQWVVQGGRVHDPRKLLESVVGQLGPRDETEVDSW